MGTLRFQHRGVANVAFLDGHVGEIAPTIPVTADGRSVRGAIVALVREAKCAGYESPE